MIDTPEWINNTPYINFFSNWRDLLNPSCDYGGLIQRNVSNWRRYVANKLMPTTFTVETLFDLVSNLCWLQLNLLVCGVTSIHDILLVLEYHQSHNNTVCKYMINDKGRLNSYLIISLLTKYFSPPTNNKTQNQKLNYNKRK